MIKIGIIGFGTVGTGVYERLESSRELLSRQLGAEYDITAILVKDRQKKRAEAVDARVTTDWETFFSMADYDLIFEAIGGIEPAFTYTDAFLQKGVPVISANKKLVAERGYLLEQAAAQHDTYYGYEAAVAGGIPIINALKGTLASSHISRVSGILNGTTNYMLTEMLEHQRSFVEVLDEAKALGYAEADPTDDLEGYDAWYKIRILSKLCFGKWPKATAFPRKGMTNLEDWHVEVGQRIGLKVKLIAEAMIQADGQIKGDVAPAFLTADEALAGVRGVTNGIALEGEHFGELLFIGPGAGKHATANSMVEDFLFHERYQGERLGAASIKTEPSFRHLLVFIKQEEREKALEWNKEDDTTVLNTFAHQNGEAWLLSAETESEIPFPYYRVYGRIKESTAQNESDLAQLGPVYL